MPKRYDIVGDVHGCFDTLRQLCAMLGYDAEFRHSGGRRLVFVGDLADRGPDSAGVLRLVCRLVRRGRALLTRGNHDEALLRWLCGERVDSEKGGLAETLAQLDAQTDKKTLKKALREMLAQAPLYLLLDGGALIVAHAGIEEAMIGKMDAETRRFVLNGDAIGRDAGGRTLRRDWAADYHGAALIVYGHTPQDEAVIRHNTINVDTGAYRGGRLTAFRWPEREIVSVLPRLEG